METYKNETEETIKVRKGTLRSGYRWYSVAPGNEIDCNHTTGVQLGLTKVDKDVIKDENKEKSSGKDPEDVGKGNKKERGGQDTGRFRQDLIDIKGIGPVYADEIMSKYPTKKELKKAIKAGKEIHIHDGVDRAVKDEYQ